jgi:proteic killer suppression protein
MRVKFFDKNLDRLDTDAKWTGGFSESLVTAFRRRMQQIRSAVDERSFYELRSLHFEKLQGSRSHQRSMRLNDQWRLILQFEESPDGGPKTAVIVAIEDYH